MMRLPRGVRRLFRLPWRSASRIRDDIDAEIAFHLDMRTEELVNTHGMDPDEARERAEREFGHVDGARRALRNDDQTIERGAHRRAWLDGLKKDVAFAARTLASAPGFAAVAVLTLALGIGGTTAVFSVVKAVLVEPLPYEAPGELVRLYHYHLDAPDENLYVSGPHFRDYREHAASFEELTALFTYRETGADLVVGDRPERVRVLRVGADYFRVLRERPVRGRAFTGAEERGRPVAIVSERLGRRLPDDRGEPGSVIALDGEPHTVVGVVAAEFRDPIVGRVDVWLPDALRASSSDEPQNHFLTVIGRLAPGVTMERARREGAALDRMLAETYPSEDDGRFRLVGLHEDVVGEARPTLLLLLGAVGLVLLLACVNVANLMMVRALERTREMAVRSALGAGRGRIVRQLLTESLVLATCGGAAGVLVATLGVDVLLAVGGDAIPRAAEVRLDAAVLGFAAAVTLITGLAFGLAPALRMAGTAPASTLREASGAHSGGRRYARVRGALVAAQVGLALMLLIGASVLATSVYRLAGVDLGIRTENVLTFELHLPGVRYDADGRADLHRRMTAGLETLPGVSAAGAASRLPATGTYHPWTTRALTGPRAGEDVDLDFQQRVVEGDYFEALGIPVAAGRTFDTRDDAGTAPVAVVSRRLADELFPGVSPIGQRITMAGREREIIGVVGDVALDPEGRPATYVYHAHAQVAADRNWPLKYVIATERDPGALVAAIRRQLAALDPQLVLHRAEPLANVLGRGRGQRRFAFVLTAAFAGLALALAVLGLYGVLAYTVRQRTREIGIRLALGAEPGRVARGVVRRGLLLAGIGLALGIVGALALRGVLASLVFRTEPTDPVILGASAALLLLVAVAAAARPAYRAMRVPPRRALDEG